MPDRHAIGPTGCRRPLTNVNKKIQGSDNRYDYVASSPAFKMKLTQIHIHVYILPT